MFRTFDEGSFWSELQKLEVLSISTEYTSGPVVSVYESMMVLGRVRQKINDQGSYKRSFLALHLFVISIL